MALDYDPTDTSEYNIPVVNIPTWVTIGECKKDTSSQGNEMLVLNLKVDQGEEGAGYKTKEYLVKGVNWKIRQVLRACGFDPDKKHPIDDVFFCGHRAQVIFKTEDWAGNDGNIRTSYKIDKWIPAEEPTENETATELQDTPETMIDHEQDPDIPF